MRAFYKYSRLYGEFFKTSLSEELSFRLNFTLQTLMNISFIGVYFFTSIFIFSHIEHIGLWNKEEFLFFLSFALAVDQSHYLLFASNFWQLSEDIRLGQMDFHLLKPAPSLFISLFRRLAVPGAATALLTYGLTLYFGLKADLSLWLWLSLPFCLLLSLALLLGIEALISMFNFFTVEGSGINQARLQIQHLARWPDFIYRNPGRLWLLPFLAITSIPVRYLLDISYWSWLAIMLLGTIFLWLAVIFLWPRALRLYESASS